MDAEPEEAPNAELTIGDLTIHPDAYMVTKNGEAIELTHREFERSEHVHPALCKRAQGRKSCQPDENRWKQRRFRRFEKPFPVSVQNGINMATQKNLVTFCP